MSKHAVEALMKAFRRETVEQGIHVSTLNPGLIQTQIFEKVGATSTDLVQHLSEHAQAPVYKSILTDMQKAGDAVGANLSPSAAPNWLKSVTSPTSVVNRSLQHAVMSRTPMPNYNVGMDSKIFYFFHALLPQRIFSALNVVITNCVTNA